MLGQVTDVELFKGINRCVEEKGTPEQHRRTIFAMSALKMTPRKGGSEKSSARTLCARLPLCILFIELVSSKFKHKVFLLLRESKKEFL